MHLLGLVGFCIVCLSQSGRTAPLEGNNALLYLQQYGYIKSKSSNSEHSGNLLTEDAYEKAIKDFQDFAGLDVTGVVDNETLHTMALPRCGVRDKIGNSERSKRYALQGSRWKVKDLTYKISKYPKKLQKRDVDKEIHRAFSVWSEYTDLSFTPARGQVHIEISFESGEHGDGDPFDGPGGTLAHAYFPVFGGDAHFDASEQWSINSYRGTNLFQVAAHEFGHSLGLSHSDIREALMAPFYRGYDPTFELHEDDINGIQALYGDRTKDKPSPGHDEEEDDFDSESNTPQVAKTPVDKSFCTDSKFDTIFNSAEGYTYVFKGDKYWRLTEQSIAPGYPKLISEGWPGLPGNINAAFTYKNGKTYFFKGSKYWRYKGRKMDGLYPKEISDGFTGVPNDVDAALVWSGNGRIYFYKGTKFWRFDPSSRPPVKSTYPKLIANWEGVPNNLDAAFQWTNGYTYFYKDNAYYRFNDRNFQVEPDFPRSTAYWWFGCKDMPSGTIQTSERRGWLVDEASVDNEAFKNTLLAANASAVPVGPKSEGHGSSSGTRDQLSLVVTLLTILTSVLLITN